MIEDRFNKALLWIAVTVSVMAFHLWSPIKVFISENYGLTLNVYHTGMAIFYFVLSIFIFYNFKRYFISFILLSLTINNLMDELFFDPTKIQLNEYIFIFIVIVFGLYRYSKNRKSDKLA